MKRILFILLICSGTFAQQNSIKALVGGTLIDGFGTILIRNSVNIIIKYGKKY